MNIFIPSFNTYIKKIIKRKSLYIILQNDIEIPLKEVTKVVVYCSCGFSQDIQCFNSVTYKKYINYQCKKCYCLSKYGVDDPNKSKIVRFKIENTNLRKYGNISPFANNKVKEKGVETTLKKYGVKNPSQSILIKEKKKLTCLSHFNCSSPFQSIAIQTKIENTNLRKYGVKNPSSSPIIKQKILATWEAKYGGNPNKLVNVKNKVKQTCLLKYGVDNPIKNPLIKEKIAQTNLRKYGYINPLLSPLVKEKIVQTNLQRYGVVTPFASVFIQNKIKIKCIEVYGVDNVSKDQRIKDKISFTNSSLKVRERVYNTRKKNNSFNSSNPELKLLEWLREIYPNICYNYHSKGYPFSCDFYIPELDLYLEFQGIWTHGKEPYNCNNQSHRDLKRIWELKNTKYYKNAIVIWTIKDPEKREIAKKNNLNFLEIWMSDYKKGKEHILELIKGFFI